MTMCSDKLGIRPSHTGINGYPHLQFNAMTIMSNALTLSQSVLSNRPCNKDIVFGRVSSQTLNHYFAFITSVALCGTSGLTYFSSKIRNDMSLKAQLLLSTARA